MTVPASHKHEGKPMSRARAIIYFIICIIFEQIGNAFLVYTEGFTVLWASAICLAAYFVTFFCFGKALKILNLGISYAVWGGVSVAVVGILTVTLLHGQLTKVDVIGMAIITLGVIGMNLWGVKETPAEPNPTAEVAAESLPEAEGENSEGPQAG